MGRLRGSRQLFLERLLQNGQLAGRGLHRLLQLDHRGHHRRETRRAHVPTQGDGTTDHEDLLDPAAEQTQQRHSN